MEQEPLMAMDSRDLHRCGALRPLATKVGTCWYNIHAVWSNLDAQPRPGCILDMMQTSTAALMFWSSIESIQMQLRHTHTHIKYTVLLFYGKGVPKKRDTYFQDSIDDVFPLGGCPCTVVYAMHRLHISWHHCPYFGIFGYYIFNSYWNPHLEHSVLGVHVQFWDLTQSSPSKTRSQTATEGQQP